jgi:hypothetical protein
MSFCSTPVVGLEGPFRHSPQFSSLTKTLRLIAAPWYVKKALGEIAWQHFAAFPSWRSAGAITNPLQASALLEGDVSGPFKRRAFGFAH